MKKILILLVLIISTFAISAQVQTINNGESGLSVRTKLNTMFSQLYDLHLTAQFSSDGTSWHDDYTSGDYYMRLSDDLGSTWTDALLLFDGINILDSLNLNSNRITNIGAAINDNDAVRLEQMVDSMATATGHDSIVYSNPWLKVWLGGDVIDSTYISDMDSSFVNITVSDTIFFAGDTIIGVQQEEAGLADNYILASKAYVDSVTIGAGGYTDEQAQDAVGAMVDDGTLGDVVFTYTDATPSLKGDVEDDSHNHVIANVDNLQTTLDGKQATITGGATTITSSNLTGNRVLISNGSGKVAVSSSISDTELSYLNNIDVNIKLKLDSLSEDVDSILANPVILDDGAGLIPIVNSTEDGLEFNSTLSADTLLSVLDSIPAIRTDINANTNRLDTFATNVYGYGFLTEEVDGSVSNELQTLSIDSTGATAPRIFTLSLSDGNSIYFKDQGTNGAIAYSDTTDLIGTKYDVDSLAENIYSEVSSLTLQDVTSNGSTTTTSITSSSFLQGTNGKFTVLTDGYLPYHNSDAVGFSNSPIYRGSSANVLIGTTIDNTVNPLQVNGSIYSRGMMYGSATETGQMISSYKQNDNVSNGWLLGYQSSTTNNFYLYGYENANFDIYTNATKRLTVTSGGNLTLQSGKGTGGMNGTSGYDWVTFNTMTDSLDLVRTSLSGKQSTLTTGNFTESVAGLELSATRQVIGGALSLSLSSGYMIPTATNSTNWTAAYNDKITTLAFTGTTTKTLTLTQQDGGTVSNTFTDLVDDADANTANEGILGVGAGASNTSVILSNTSGATGVTVTASTGLSISESTSSNGGNITLTNTVLDDQTASEVSITDAGGYYTGTDVEAALQEIGSDLAGGIGGAFTNVAGVIYSSGTPSTDKLIVGANTSSGSYIFETEGNTFLDGTLTVDGEIKSTSPTGAKLTLRDIEGTPGTPNTGDGTFYVNGDTPYFINDSGTTYNLASGGGGGAPTDATYLVTTSNGTLTNEVVVGTTPSGDLGGTWSNISVDNDSHTHSSSTITDKGSTTQVLYNNGGTISGDADMTFDGTNMQVGGYITSDESRVQSLNTNSSTVTFNYASGANAIITVTTNTTFTISMSGIPTGKSGNITIVNTTAGGLATFSGYTNKINPSIYAAPNSVATSGSSKIDMLSYYYDGTRLIWNGQKDYQ